ncbi:hypothetical protein [Methanomethylophilus alvi]|uniref:hypothetical protein n=1 Tax=Methanomethylophilus alvi TaxID=1291540 RepID=UPI0037DD7D2A
MGAQPPHIIIQIRDVMEQYSQDENNGKKKLLVPLILLLLCVASAVGAGYALSSNIFMNDNNPDTAEISLTVVGEGPAFTTGGGEILVDFVQDTEYNLDENKAYVPTYSVKVCEGSSNNADIEVKLTDTDVEDRLYTLVASIKAVNSSTKDEISSFSVDETTVDISKVISSWIISISYPEGNSMKNGDVATISISAVFAQDAIDGISAKNLANAFKDVEFQISVKAEPVPTP